MWVGGELKKEIKHTVAGWDRQRRRTVIESARTLIGPFELKVGTNQIATFVL